MMGHLLGSKFSFIRFEVLVQVIFDGPTSGLSLISYTIGYD